MFHEFSYVSCSLHGHFSPNVLVAPFKPGLQVWKGSAVEVTNQNERELLGHLAIAGYTKDGPVGLDGDKTTRHVVRIRW